MRCMKKIPCDKIGSCPQRRIHSQPEEKTYPPVNLASLTTTTTTTTSTAAATTSTTTSTATATATATMTTSIVIASANPMLYRTTTTTTCSNQRIAPPRPVKSIAAKKGEDTTKLLKYIDDNVIGKNGTFLGPFGRRKVVYCDYTASGRSLQFLEEYISKEVLPCLGDTRASTSICSLQSSLFRHEARDIVRHAVGAGEQDAVIFTGQGTAAALRTLLRHLDLSKSTTVFVGPFEHHANLRPWREYGVRIVRVAETPEGFLDLNDLERSLIKVRAEGVTQMIGSFSAASCITGVLADDVATTLLLHQYGALSVWDYTTAAPYVQVDMNPHLPGVGETAVHKDAIIFAGHKFIGGVQSPDILVTKRSLLKDRITTEDMRDCHRYHRDPELREESGTAGVVESIRCGLAVQLKENVTPRAIVGRQDKICRQVLAHVRTIPELILLGSSSQNVKRLPIFSFMVRHPRGTFLHHNFVCAVLNDVFGIQARGGCACAGRYAHNLMGIDQELAKEYQKVLVEGERTNEETCAEGLRPGFAKLSFPYFMTEAEVAFVLEALKMVATEGWKLLPQYVLNPDTGEWRHHTNSVFKERKWLGSIRYTDGKMNASERRVSGSGVFPQTYGDCLHTARNIFNRARKKAQKYPLQIDHSFNFVTTRMEVLRWFMLPSEAQDLLLGNSQNVKQDVPFNPTQCWNRPGHHTPTTSHDSLVNSSSLVNSIRRLNSDIPRTGTVPVLPNSPRHKSLPILGTDRRALIGTVEHKSSLSNHSSGNEDDHPTYGNQCNHYSGGHRSPATCPSSPMPVRFAVGEAVTPSALRTMSHASNQPIKEQRELLDSNNAGRARCNSLGSTNGQGAVNTTGNHTVVSSLSSPTLPIPLSPQTRTSLGLTGTNSESCTSHGQRLHCSCSSQTDLNSLEYDNASPVHSILALNCHNPTSPPSSFSSAGDCNERFIVGGRSSPLSGSVSQRSKDNLSYVKEVTEELATEIKSEIREVISKVDGALTESNTSENTPQHHPRYHNTISQLCVEDKRIRHDSFTASDIAEYLMEFSKKMASEVKSDIRCMVNAVDGLHRHSPDTSVSDTSSNGCGSPDKGRILPSSPPLSVARRNGPIEIVGKISELSQEESKMSSECSSDETAIYVAKPTENSNDQVVDDQTKVVDDDDDLVTGIDELTDDCEEQGISEISDDMSSLPKVCSTVSSDSCDDTGISLSFHKNAASLDSVDLKCDTSIESNSTNGSHVNDGMTSDSDRIVENIRENNNSVENEDYPGKTEEKKHVRQEENEDKQKDKNDEDRDYKPDWHSPPDSVWQPTLDAIEEFKMIRHADRILVCLSPDGGDSLLLLHTLYRYQLHVKPKGIYFAIAVATVDTWPEDNTELSRHISALHLLYFDDVRIRDPPYSRLETDACSFRNRTARLQLYNLARRYGYNVLAVGQHLDDVADSLYASVFCGGKLQTMKAHYYNRLANLRVIRPFIYVREKALRQFAESNKFPESLRRNLTERKSNIKELILQEEQVHPNLSPFVRKILRTLLIPHKTTPAFDLEFISELSKDEFFDCPYDKSRSMTQRWVRRTITFPGPCLYYAPSYEVNEDLLTDEETVPGDGA